MHARTCKPSGAISQHGLTRRGPVGHCAVGSARARHHCGHEPIDETENGAGTAAALARRPPA
eukprot:5829777-Lingulodinium_polyedra.AAC.1